jgi:hypothetical protein
MIHETDSGAYLFGYRSLKDGPADFDEWYETVVEAEAACLDSYGIQTNDGQLIDDPMEGCQQDWIDPVRVRGRISGRPEFGNFERFEDGVWKPIDNENA